MVDFTVIIPTFNESSHIEKTMHRTYENLNKLKLNPEILVIDDSNDNTHEILRKLLKKYKTLKIIHRKNKTGVGSAIRLGIEKAKHPYVIVHMADAPDDTKYFSGIINKFEKGYDVVQTSRFFPGCKMRGYPLKKRIGNWLCNNFVRVVFLRFDLKDFSSLFKGFNKKKIIKLNLESNEFDLGLEIVLKSIRKKYKITEVPVDWYERDAGESKLKLFKYAKYYFLRVIKIWLTYRD